MGRILGIIYVQKVRKYCINFKFVWAFVIFIYTDHLIMIQIIISNWKRHKGDGSVIVILLVLVHEEEIKLAKHDSMYQNSHKFVFNLAASYYYNQSTRKRYS